MQTNVRWWPSLILINERLQTAISPHRSCLMELILSHLPRNVVIRVEKHQTEVY